jgi:hypothetical protein
MSAARTFSSMCLRDFAPGIGTMNLFPAVGSWQNRRNRADAMGWARIERQRRGTQRVNNH